MKFKGSRKTTRLYSFEKPCAIVVARLIWVGFKKFFVERLTPKYQNLHEGMNLV